jgi:hypothetical protein
MTRFRINHTSVLRPSSKRQQPFSMDSAFLVPPNYQQLSNDVIGSVQQRTRHVRHSRSAPTRRIDTSDAKATPEDDGWSPTSVKRRKLEHKAIDLSSLKRLHAATIADRKKAPLTRAAIASEEHTKIMDLLRLAKTMERERRRVNQRKYRKKQEDLTATLETETQQLRDEVSHLEQQRLDISGTGSVWEVTSEYFRLLRDSLHSRTHSSDVGLRFLQRTMVPAVVYNSFQGPKMILSSWASLQQLSDVEVELQALQRVANGSLEAVTTTSFTITERTLRTVFPHLCTNEIKSLSPLAMKLLDKRVVLRGSTRFEWDSSSDRVNRVTTQADFLTPALRLVRRLELAARVFEKALVTPDFQWR